MSKAQRAAKKRRIQGIQVIRYKKAIRTEGYIQDLRSILGLDEQPQQSYTLLALDTELVNTIRHFKITC